MNVLNSKLFEQACCDLDNQKQSFAEFHQPPEKQDDEYLAILKDYTAKLEKRFEGLQPILSRILRRKELVEERKKYDALISDPNRLTSRGRGLSQLKETEMRIRVEKKLPKLQLVLKEVVNKWQVENETVLVYDGTPFLDTMQAEQQAYEEMIEQRKQSRTQALKQKKQEENKSTTWKRNKRTLNKSGRKKFGTTGPENKAVTKAR
jgi:hypothetical protein